MLPLEGTRVVDLTTVLAGPLCTMMLGDAGADVVKVEPPGGDPSRGMGPPFYGGQGAEFLALNRNKRSVVLDLKTRTGMQGLLSLCDSADVLVENYRTGVTERLGIDYANLSTRNPRLIYCSISGFGRSGPRKDEPAYDAIMQAFVGMMASTGTEDCEPVRANVSICDIGAAMYANQAILLALAARERSGHGQFVEASMLETQVAWLLYRAVGYFVTGSAPARRLGSAAPHVVPYEAYRTRDGYLMAGALNDKLFRKMMSAMSLDHLGADPRFSENSARVANRVELKTLLEAEFCRRSTRQWMEVFSRAGIPHSPVNTVEDVLEDPQVLARNMITEVEHPSIGSFKMPSIPIRLSDTPGTIRRPPPTLAEHQDVVFFDDGKVHWLNAE